MRTKIPKVQVSAKIDHTLEEMITKRASLMNCSKSQYFEAIIKHWYDQGAPSVHPHDYPDFRDVLAEHVKPSNKKVIQEIVADPDNEGVMKRVIRNLLYEIREEESLKAAEESQNYAAPKPTKLGKTEYPPNRKSPANQAKKSG